jgi:hypothetical protein
MQQHLSTPAFPLGQIVITSHAQGQLHPEDVSRALRRHGRTVLELHRTSGCCTLENVDSPLCFGLLRDQRRHWRSRKHGRCGRRGSHRCRRVLRDSAGE